jgi:hypothetical protein
MVDRDHFGTTYGVCQGKCIYVCISKEATIMYSTLKPYGTCIGMKNGG